VIVRVLTAQVRPGRVGQFNVAMRRQLAIMREQPGLLYLKLARRLDGLGGEEVVLFEEWQDPDSVYAWAGEDLSRPRLLPAASDAAAEVTVTHYESLDGGLEGDDLPFDEAWEAGSARDRPSLQEEGSS
jgi:heme-degrading monooxygenase HmoA